MPGTRGSLAAGHRPGKADKTCGVAWNMARVMGPVENRCQASADERQGTGLFVGKALCQFHSPATTPGTKQVPNPSAPDAGKQPELAAEDIAGYRFRAA